MSMPMQPQPRPTPRPTTYADPTTSPTPQDLRREPTNEEIALIESGAHRAALPPRSRRERRRPVRRVVGATIAAAVIGSVGYYAVSPEQTSHDSWTATGVNAVVIDNAVGNVTIKETDGNAVTYSEDLQYRGSTRTTEHRVDGTTLHIDLGGGKGVSLGFMPGGSKLDYVIEVPKGTAITYEQDAGELDIDGTLGAVSIHSSAGEIDSAGLTATSLTVQMSAGNIDLKKVACPTVEVKQSAGNTDLSFTQAPDDLKIDVSAGNVDVAVPDGVYEVTKRVSAGNVNVDVPTGTSDHDIDIRISAGNVKVRKA